MLWLPLHGYAQTGYTYRLYTARDGERPADIAHRFTVPLKELLRVNPLMEADRPLRRGEVVLVPVKAASAKPSPTPSHRSSSFQSPPSVARAYWVYTVQSGDTLESVAHRFGISVTALAQANGLSNHAPLVVGQVLMVPVVEQSMSVSFTAPSNVTTVRNVASRRVSPLPAPRVFGHVGVVVVSTAAIRSAPHRTATVWSRVFKGTLLVITQERDQWWGVLMINGATGWVPKTAVRKTGQPLLWDDMMQVFAQNGGSGQALVVREAVRYLGAPYRYGGTSPLSGLDCSAFVQQVFARRGVRLPRTAAEQAQVGIPVSVADLRPGDRLYFSVRGRRVDHCGIYIGNGLFIHASGRHDAVVISRLDEPLYARSLVAIRRD